MFGHDPEILGSNPCLVEVRMRLAAVCPDQNHKLSSPGNNITFREDYDSAALVLYTYLANLVNGV